MDYAVERDGGGTRILLENGDRVTIKLVVGTVKPGDKNPDGSPGYNVQWQVACFVETAEGAAVKPAVK